MTLGPNREEAIAITRIVTAPPHLSEDNAREPDTCVLRLYLPASTDCGSGIDHFEDSLAGQVFLHARMLKARAPRLQVQWQFCGCLLNQLGLV